MSVGENIRRIREQRGITQIELAACVDITRSMMSQIEKGIKNPSLQTGKAIADRLECSLEELLE